MVNELSDCKYAGPIGATGMIRCEKRKIYVTGDERKTCDFYEKG